MKLRENLSRSVMISGNIFAQPTGVLGLEARGKNQLIKELNECADLDSGPSFKGSDRKKIVFIKEAIHRNEDTGEIEPTGTIDEYIDLDVRQS